MRRRTLHRQFFVSFGSQPLKTNLTGKERNLDELPDSV
jgi:hypothetical protein